MDAPNVPDRMLKTLHVTTREAWRAWLAKHHASTGEIWLLYAKRHTGQPRFTPRRPGSKWSGLNRIRFAKLLRDGRVTQAGLAKAPPPKSVDPGPARYASSEPAVPVEFRRALRARPAAWRNFEDLAPSYRRLYIRWIAAAKRDATRARRIEEAVALLAGGKKLGLK